MPKGKKKPRKRKPPYLWALLALALSVGAGCALLDPPPRVETPMLAPASPGAPAVAAPVTAENFATLEKAMLDRVAQLELAMRQLDAIKEGGESSGFLNWLGAGGGALALVTLFLRGADTEKRKTIASELERQYKELEKLRDAFAKAQPPGAPTVA